MNTSLPIQSISIPTYTKVTNESSPYITYNIQITTPTSTYTVSHRYTNFLNLSNLISPTPLPLPSTTSGWNVRSILSLGKKELSETELIERRRGLEGWLRAILSSKDGKWSNSLPFKEFLRPPGGVGLDDSSSTSISSFTAASWSTEHSLLVTLSRSIRSLLNKRDNLLLQRDASAHTINSEARKNLVDLVRRIGILTKSLKFLGEKGLSDGELRRRSQLLGNLQDEAETLGKLSNDRPKVVGGTTREEVGGYSNLIGARTALLGSSSAKVPSRVLGFNPTATETPETRPLDNRGLLQLQEVYEGEQDSKLENLTKILRRQKELGMMIGDELDLQKDLLDGLDRDSDKLQSKMKEAGKQMKRLG